jgi:mono/diheme cytochrome c family protein
MQGFGKYFLLPFVLVILAVVCIAGFRGNTSRKPPIEVFPDMDRQPKVRPQTDYRFFNDTRSSRLPVAGTIARSKPMNVGGKEIYLFEDSPVNTGRQTGTTNYVDFNPLPVTEQLMARGQERFNIYCAPCHGSQGDGKGITTKFGMAVIADLHDAGGRRIPQQPDGQIFETISNGKGQMGAYGGIIPVEDRWAIIAYVRALQRSHLASIEDVPAEFRSKLPVPAGTSGGAGTNSPATVQSAK